MSDERNKLRRRWAVVHHYHDGSGVIRAWGPFPTEEAANAWQLPDYLTNDAMTVVELLEPPTWESGSVGGEG